LVVEHYQDPVRAHGLKAGRPLQQAADDAPLHVQSVLRHLIQIGTVHHVRMQDQPVADCRQQPGRRTRIPRVPPISQPIPVGTSSTTLKALVFSKVRREKSKIEPGVCGGAREPPASSPTSH